MCYTLEQVCPKEDYVLIGQDTFTNKRRTLFRDDKYRQRWVLPKKFPVVVITDEENNGLWIPKRNNRNSKMRYGAHNRTFA